MKSAARLLVATMIVSVTALWASGAADRPTPTADPSTDYLAYTAQTLRQHFPNVRLVTQDNKTVHFYDDVIKGRTVILQFMFANCEKACPLVTPNLAKVQRELMARGASEISIVSITVDPVHDTPQVLQHYAHMFNVQPGWRFLTGSKTDIDQIRRELGVWDPDEQQIEHMNVLTIGRESTGQWIAIGGLSKPDDIVQTVLRLAPTDPKSSARRNPASRGHSFRASKGGR